MKKLPALFTGLLFVVLLTGCGSSKNSISAPAFSFDNRGNYTAFSNMPTAYHEDTAEKDGCAVRRDAKFIANERVWTDFVKTASSGKDAAVRIANFDSKDQKGPSFQDVYYRSGSYYLFESGSNDLGKHPFKYLLTLTGKDGKPPRDSTAVVLTDDKNLVFSEVMKSFYSSNMRVTSKISSFGLILLQ